MVSTQVVCFWSFGLSHCGIKQSPFCRKISESIIYILFITEHVPSALFIDFFQSEEMMENAFIGHKYFLMILKKISGWILYSYLA